MAENSKSALVQLFIESLLLFAVEFRLWAKIVTIITLPSQ